MPARRERTCPSSPAPRFEYSHFDPGSRGNVVVRRNSYNRSAVYIRVRIQEILRREIGGHARQPRHVSREIFERNRTRPSLRDLDALRQILRDGIAERDLATLHHIGEQQRRKHLRDGTDLEERIGLDVALRHNPPPCASITPATIPRAWRSRSIRSERILRTSSSDCAKAIAPAPHASRPRLVIISLQ